ncbi:MAG TPA: SEC-C metal-binding domain-containing protein [Candidatus Cryptobacteroides sp.]|nr:SEC-C metal-binding domain-containing protein [Candidatus Cryptobacteroides sp.]
MVYKLESYNLFADMLESLNRDVLTFLLRAFVPLRDASEAGPPNRAQRRAPQLNARREDLSTNAEQRSNTPVKAEKKIGRNDPCPCGSGKKYKHCHGKGLV